MAPIKKLSAAQARQANIIAKEAATKKPGIKKTSASSVPLDIDLGKLAPGQKISFEIKAKKTQIRNIKNKIDELQLQLRNAQRVKQLTLANKIEGLITNLTALEQAIQGEIAKLKKTASANLMSPQQKQLMEIIQQRCAGYIAQFIKGNAYLYRGSTGASEFIGRSWDSRQSKHSYEPAQELFDVMLARQGFVALRGNSIFATSDWEHASEFGDKVYFIFPVDGLSHYTYTNRNDLVLHNLTEVGVNKDLVKDIVDQVIQGLNTYNKTLKKHEQSEIQHTVDLFKVNPTNVFNWLAHHKNDADKDKYNIPSSLWNLTVQDCIKVEDFNKKFAPQNTDLAQALYEQWEVYISGVYYALEYEKYYSIVENVFGIEPYEF